MPSKARGGGARARAAAEAIVERFGYLQLDTVSIAGARSHVLVLLSRLEGLDPELGESLLRPGRPLFEYWGHEACWIPHDLYPAFAFRREAFRHHPWWGDVLGAEPRLARELLRRIEDEGPLRSVDLEGEGSSGWWDLKVGKRVALALWSKGELAIRERRGFQRTYDLEERVVPAELRARPLAQDEGLEALLLRALDGHGWATTGTLAATWRLRNLRTELRAALARLEARGEVLPCGAEDLEGRRHAGWIRPAHLEELEGLRRLRPNGARGVLLSPFDPVLWDRDRVARFFGFEMLLEIFKPRAERRYGYYCLPVLAGEELVARVDLKADRRAGMLRLLSRHFERDPAPARDRAACASALERLSESLGLELRGAARRKRP